MHFMATKQVYEKVKGGKLNFPLTFSLLGDDFVWHM